MKNAKVIFFSDSHLGFDYPIRPRKDYAHRGQDFFDNFQNVLDHAIKVKADLVLHGGDLFFRSKVPHQIVSKAYDIILKFAENGIPLVILPGNHERSKLPNPLFLSHKNIFVFEDIDVKRFDLQNIKIEIAGFPFIREIRDSFKNIQSSFKFSENSFRIFLNHQTISGAKVEHYTFRRGKNIINIEALSPQYDLVLSGHIHRYQILRYKGKKKTIPIIYSGSIERTSFQEVNEDKGFIEISIRKNLTFKTKFRKLATRPMYMIEVDSSWNKNNIKQKISDSIKNLPSNSIIRFFPNKGFSLKIKNVFRKDTLYKIIPKTIIIEIHSKLLFKRNRGK